MAINLTQQDQIFPKYSFQPKFSHKHKNMGIIPFLSLPNFGENFLLEEKTFKKHKNVILIHPDDQNNIQKPIIQQISNISERAEFEIHSQYYPQIYSPSIQNNSFTHQFIKNKTNNRLAFTFSNPKRDFWLNIETIKKVQRSSNHLPLVIQTNGLPSIDIEDPKESPLKKEQKSSSLSLSTDISPLFNESRQSNSVKDEEIGLTKLSKRSKKIKILSDSVIRLNPKQQKAPKTIKKVFSSEKKVYEISRFFVKNYVGALKSTINNVASEQEIKNFIGIDANGISESRQELDKLLKDYPKHNRIQLYKLITNKKLNPLFQFFLTKKVYSWIFASSKMQDKKAHLLARKNFLHLCQRANELTPYNFRIALNSK